MKYEDIPKLTSKGNYETTVDLKYLVETVEKWINDDFYNLQLNPDFQRGNVWTEVQQIAYVEYILRGGQSAKLIHFNMPSWLGSYIIDDYDDFVCVDGLQRLTALMKFLKNELKAFGHYYNEFEGRIPSSYSVNFNINNLKTKKEVLQWYVEMNTSGTVHTDEEINRVKEMILELEKNN